LLTAGQAHQAPHAEALLTGYEPDFVLGNKGYDAEHIRIAIAHKGAQAVIPPLNLTLWNVGLFLRYEQMRGTLESNWLCPVSRIALPLGGSLAKLGNAPFFLMVTVLEFRLLGVRLLGSNPWLLLLVLLLTIGSVYGIGLAFAGLVLRFKKANAMVFLVRGIFLVFCGITYPLAVLPGWMQGVAACLPLTYAIRAIRAVSLSGAGFGEVLPDLLALVGFALVLPVTGVLAFQFTEKQARRTGSLGHY